MTSFTFGTSAFNDISAKDPKSDLIDSLQIKETIMLRVNDALKAFKPPEDKTDVCALFNAILPAMIGALGTCISVAVGEVMDKAMRKIELHTSNKASDPVLMANVRRLTFENDRLQQYTRRENLRVFGVPVDKDETAEATEKKPSTS